MSVNDYEEALSMWKELVRQGLAKPRGYRLAGPCDIRPARISQNDHEWNGNGRLDLSRSK